MNKTIYIRKEDEERWNSIPDKPLFIHEALLGSPHKFHPNMAMPTTLKEANNPKSPGYSAKIKPEITHYKPTSNWGA